MITFTIYYDAYVLRSDNESFVYNKDDFYLRVNNDRILLNHKKERKTIDIPKMNCLIFYLEGEPYNGDTY